MKSAMNLARDSREAEGFRFRLRKETRAEHEALDAHPAFAAMMNGTLGAAGYSRLMTLFFGFYSRHDPVLARACAEHSLDRFGFAYRARSAILRDDLAALGIDADHGVEHDRRAEADLSPVTATQGGIAGVLYVIEGSMLGGAVLARAVHALAGPLGADGYWRWCRDDGAARWAMTCGMIEHVSATDINRTDMIAGARLAFASFGRWLARWSDDRAGSALRRSGVRC